MLVFLDIDGVMVPAKGWKSPEFLSNGFPAFSSKAVYALQHIISNDVTVILTTSHKENFSLDEWKTILKNRSINVHNLQYLRRNVGNLSRNDEIANWFSANNVNEDFIIIDDDKSLNDLPDYLKQNLIQTSPYIGLTEEHLVPIQAIFQKSLHTT